MLIFEKGRDTQIMSDMYVHRISKGELYLRGNNIGNSKIKKYDFEKVSNIKLRSSDPAR